MGCDNWYDSWDCATKSLSDNVNSAVNTLSRGDIAKVVGNQTKALKNIYSAPVEAGLDLIKGDTKSAGSRFVKAAGSVGYIAAPGSNIWATESGQKVLRDTKIGSNYAGFNAGLVQMRDSGTISNQYRDETIRYGAEAAVVGGGIYAYNNPVIPTFTEAGSVSGSELVKGAGSQIGNWWSTATAKDIVLYGSAAKGLVKSENPLKEITKEILGSDVADVLFPPTNPTVSNPSDPEEFGPWDSSVSSGVNPVVSKQGSSTNTATILLVISGVLVTFLIIKRIS